ncbi:MAG: MBOAT family protein [Candidatus Thermoplasmatota archaeon]|nr:MBOAT family protein [Candidatus Thermoplasmatota archaeon]
MSYTIDVYRKKMKPTEEFFKYLLYVAYFPQLVAGPIVRACDMLPQLDEVIFFKKEKFWTGFQLFVFGLIQKRIFADNLSVFVDNVFSDPLKFDPVTLWIALIAYSIQIFCDFSGYSLMAIGIAKTFGHDFPTNFDYPYLSHSVKEFWRRWHISLSTWLKDYLYISLGGNRKGDFRTRVNLTTTMLLGGLWHGASWNFVIWGFLHGIALVIYPIISKKIKPPALIAWLSTFLFVLITWIPFRSSSLQISINIFKGLLGTNLPAGRWLFTPALIIIFLFSVWHLYIIFSSKKPEILWHFRAKYTVFAMIILLFIYVLFMPLKYTPFVYFQF